MQFVRRRRFRPSEPAPWRPDGASSKRREENGKMTIKTKISGHGASVSPETSRKVKNLGLLCSILVVAYHVEWPKEVPFSLGWFVYQGIADGLARMAVPFFFVVSGFFLARHCGEKGWWLRETRKRARSLLQPFFLWSLAALLVSLLSPVIDGMLTKHLAETSSRLPRLADLPRFFGLDFSRYPLNYPLWYLRCLFVLVFLSPVLEHLVAAVRRPFLAAAFCLLLFCWRLPVGHWHVCLFHAPRACFISPPGLP